MTDIHCHLLNNVDDGSSSFEESLQLLNEEKEQGVKTVFLTPHFYNPRKTKYTEEEIITKFLEFKEKTKNLGIDLYLGAECYYGPDFIEALKNKTVRGYNGSNTILLEFSLGRPMDIDDNVYSTVIKGYNVILAHPCRYPEINIETLKEVKKSKAKLQINASSIMNKKSKKVRKLALELLKLHLVDYVASDAHNLNRNVLMQQAYKFVSKKYGKDYADLIFITNQEKLITSVIKTEE